MFGKDMDKSKVACFLATLYMSQYWQTNIF